MKNPRNIYRVEENADIDHRLMRDYLNGDVTAFTAIYNRFRGRVYSYLMKRTLKAQDADELLQLVFVKFHESRHQFSFEYSLLQWLYVISRSTFIDFYRKAQVMQTVSIDQEMSEKLKSDIPDEEEELVSFKIIEQLPEEHQDIIRSRLIDNQSYQEIASRLSRSETSIRQIFSRAMKKLRSQILTE